ncbi:MAG: preprotein translocase subunit SecG [Chitinispirillaceae bacterium]
MLFGILIVLYVFVCLILIFLVIIQSDKGGGISGAIGGGMSGANQFLGTQDTANILTRSTTGFAIGYMMLCVVLSLFLSRGAAGQQRSALQERAETVEEYSPASALGQGGGGLQLQQQEEAQDSPQEGQQQAPAPQQQQAPAPQTPEQTQTPEE